MKTPFSSVIEQIRERGFHNHRLEEHSDIVSDGILRDLSKNCPPVSEDLASGIVKPWKNVHTPRGRRRKIDLLLGEPDPSGNPDLERLRICIENKSVVTAHRNVYARFDDLNEALQVLHSAQSEAVLIATIIVGVAERVLNVPDKVKPHFRKKQGEFKDHILPRLSTGDQSLWDEFDWAISQNRPDDPKRTIEKFRELPTRHPGRTHLVGYDYILFIPAHIDNVNPPYIPEPGAPKSLGVDLEREYEMMVETMCRAYTVRFR